ncbi:MAG TPA: TspO/MBR family protein [Terracidiphilus sp.]|nr:TspO/MBR family protein [Terracidiphilus sp.]
MKNAGGLIVCFIVAFAAAALGAIASVRAAEFYQQLSRPGWAPPAGVFGPVWTALYCSMAFASWLVWKQSTERSCAALAVYALQLALNALWSWLFFAWRQGWWAFVGVLVLWACILATIVLFWRVKPAAAILLVPYFLWVSFASCLTFAVWRLNPRLLS